MALCVVKEGVKRLLAKAQAALATAEGEQADALHDLVLQCNQALAKAKRWPGYPGGRLDTSQATAAFNAADQLRKRFPDLLAK